MHFGLPCIARFCQLFLNPFQTGWIQPLPVDDYSLTNQQVLFMKSPKMQWIFQDACSLSVVYLQIR